MRSSARAAALRTTALATTLALAVALYAVAASAKVPLPKPRPIAPQRRSEEQPRDYARDEHGGQEFRARRNRAARAALPGPPR